MLLPIIVTLTSLVTLFLVFGAVRETWIALHELDRVDLVIESTFSVSVFVTAAFAIYAVWQ